MTKIARYKDPNHKAKQIVGLATGEVTDPEQNDGKDPAMIELGRLGGL